mgnify:CR=1 FL=1
MTRVVMVSGKGGVGKTTIAAATALRAAQCGHSALVASLDECIEGALRLRHFVESLA